MSVASPQTRVSVHDSLRRALLLAAGMLITACSALPGGQSGSPLAYYLLELPGEGSEAAQAAGRGCGVLEVTAPVPAPGFGSSRMIYRREQHRLEHFAYTEWAATPSRMIEPLLIQAMERTGEFATVMTAPAPVKPRIRLEASQLKVLQVFDAAGSHARLELRVQMLDPRRRTLLGARTLSASAPATADPAGGVAAANVALGRVLDELSRFAADVSSAADCGNGMANLP